MKILAVETSATSASVSLIEEGKILSENFINIGLTHSQTVMLLLDGVLKNAKIDIKEIDLFAVATGPGSFTGVRIGVSVVKGLAMSLNKPCVGVSTLESMAYNFQNINCVVCCAMDARRQQVYNSIFKITGNEIQRLTQDRAIKIENLKEELSSFSETVYIVGDGAKLVYNSIENNENIKLAPIRLMYQNASSVAVLAEKKSTCDGVSTAEELLPTYLRLSQAERELKKRNEGEC